MRKMGEQPRAESCHVRRGHGVYPFHDLEIECSWPRHIHAKHWVRFARVSTHGCMGFLWPWQPQSQSSDIRRPAGCARFCTEWPRKLERWIPAGRASRHDDSRGQTEPDFRFISAVERKVHLEGERARFIGSAGKTEP